MKTTQPMSAPPPWYKADNPSYNTKIKVSIVSFWTKHAFKVATQNCLYYFADPIGCTTQGEVIVQCAIKSALSSARIFHTIYIDTNYDIHDQLLVQLRYMVFQMDPQLVFDSACCGIDEGYLCAGCL